MKRLGSSKSNMTTDLTEAAIGLAGGIAANQASTALEKSSILGQNGKMAPLAVSLLAVVAYIFAPKGALKTAAYGAVIVSGTEQVETVTAGLLSGEYTMGFTPQIIPQQFAEDALNVNGVPLR